MRIFAALVAGLLIGWFARQWTFEEPTARSTRRSDVIAGHAPERTQPPPREAPKATPPPRPEPTAEEEPAPEPPDASDAPEEDDPIGKMIRSQSAMWKGMVSMQVKPKIEAMLLEGIDLDAATEERIEKAMLEEAERQMDRVIEMMLGNEELDPDAFSYFMGLPAELSPELEKELATFLSDAEIANVRAEVKRGYEKQMTDLADVQIKMMAVPNLRDDQRERLRDIFRGKNFMKEQFQGFAELTRDRKKLMAAIDGDIDIGKHMEKNFEPMRRRVRDILDDTQFGQYEAYEKQMIAQAQMGFKMMSSLVKQANK
jgi:hypothetical protein